MSILSGLCRVGGADHTIVMLFLNFGKTHHMITKECKDFWTTLLLIPFNMTRRCTNV